MKFARIDDFTGLCNEFIDFDPAGKFHPLIKWLPVPEHLEAYADTNYKEGNGAVVPPSLEYLREQVKARLAQARLDKEVGGIDLPDGTKIHTDRESQAQLSSAYSSLSTGLIQSTPWKAKNGWVNVSAAEITPVAAAVASHVAKCFAIEKALSDEIDAITTVQELAQFDVYAAIQSEEAALVASA